MSESTGEWTVTDGPYEYRCEYKRGIISFIRTTGAGGAMRVQMADRDEFLAGKLHGVIKAVFGQVKFDELLATVQRIKPRVFAVEDLFNLPPAPTDQDRAAESLKIIEEKAARTPKKPRKARK